MSGIFIEYNVAYLPQPNRVELVLTDEIAPHELTKTAFVVPVFPEGNSFLLAVNKRRGIEIAGGHVEADETLMEAASREGLEETGVEVADLVPIGYLRMTLMGEVPPDYAYPHPLSYQQFFAGRIIKIHPYVENDECLTPYRCYDVNEEKITRLNIAVLGQAAINSVNQ